ncbi:MAG: PEP-CTERM sorting domain-containing protein [Burkholderiales bacterium]|nr:PEP-CTERM sorting domain-containing protein [Burkholderiales bacterium]
MNLSLATAAAAFSIFLAASAHAALDVDEATHPGAAGDYNNLLLLDPPVTFALEGGTNLFSGTFGTGGSTPSDGGDTVVLELGALEAITAVRITFATNAVDVNPVAINQGTRLVLDVASSSSTTPLLDLAIAGRPDGPVVFSSAPLTLAPDLYNLTLLTGVLALNDSARVGYTIAIDVVAIPEPATAMMLLLGLSLLAYGVRRGTS